MDNLELSTAVGQLAEFYFQEKTLCCSQAVLVATNQIFGGTLSYETAARLGSGFCGGIGNSGGLCGALSGLIMALGLLAGDLEKSISKKNAIRKAAQNLQNQFTERYGSVCCRDLIEPFQNEKSKCKAFCQGITGGGAEMLTNSLLKLKPNLASTGQNNIGKFPIS